MTETQVHEISVMVGKINSTIKEWNNNRQLLAHSHKTTDKLKEKKDAVTYESRRLKYLLTELNQYLTKTLEDDK